ncbi:MAG: hypothetical protein HYW24_01430 [Candidatus Aenigmarchaeota archaeon]|nr:hypothetical protein [Candidatus Aenigmarchaeota archaeon]
MKGAVEIALVAFVSMLTIVSVFSFNVAYEIDSVVRDQNERIIREGVSQIEFAKRGIEQSLIYSTYQVAYDVLRYGEYSVSGCYAESFNVLPYETLPYWRTYEKTCMPTYGLSTSCAECVLNNRNDILLFYQQNGWSTDRSNQANILNDWCGISPEECDTETAKCGTCLSTSSEFDNVLGQKTQTMLNEYVSAINEKTNTIHVQSPTTAVKLQIKGNRVNVTATSSEKTKFTETNVEISDSPNAKKILNLRIAKLISKGKELFIDKDVVKEQIDAAESRIPDACKSIKYEECYTSSIPSKSKKEMLDEACPNVLTNFRTDVVNNILSLNNKYNTIDTDVTLKTNNDLTQVAADTNKEATCTIEDISAPESCCLQRGCERSDYTYDGAHCVKEVDREITGDCPSGSAEQPNGKCLSYISAICIKPQNLYKKTCSYDYSANANVYVSILGKEIRYPLYDKVEKTSAMRNLELTFYVLGGEQIPS